MNIYSNVTEQDLIFLRKLADQQKNQRAVEIKKRISKQSHDIRLAKSLSLKTKKLDTIIERTKRSGKDRKESISENNQETVPSEIDILQTKLKSIPNNSIFSISMRQKL